MYTYDVDEIENLKKEIVSLKIRLRRIEEFLLGFPDISEYIIDDRKKQIEFEPDPLFDKATELIKNYDKVSASLLQRRLAIGYSRAARLLDQLEEKGYLGPGEGAKPRKVNKE